MRAYTHEIIIPKQNLNLSGLEGLRQYYDSSLKKELPLLHKPIRFVITDSTAGRYNCELDLLTTDSQEEFSSLRTHSTIFDYRKRRHEKNTDEFICVLLIPTGIGAEIGGQCGDGNAVARLVASACDKLITHPNVVNASDINEMTPNTLYVEGSIITRFLMGQIGLAEVRSNKMLMLMDKHSEKYFNDEIINAVSSARITLGIDCDVYEMDNIIKSVSVYSGSGRAVGTIDYLERLFEIVNKYKKDYDAIGLSTFIEVPDCFHQQYFKDDEMVNPWGGIEAMLTHSIAENFNLPCAHSPIMTSSEVMNLHLGIVDPRKAPETSSTTYLHCILKGLHRAPQITDYDKGITLEDVSCLIIPEGCVGLPTLSCVENNIPVIAVKENKNYMKNQLFDLPFKKDKFFLVDNYLEAVGIMNCLKAGIAPEVTRRPIKYTTCFHKENL